MQINVANQRILLISDVINHDEAQEKAWAKKTTAFDAVSQVTNFFSKPKDDDFKLIYFEHRYQSFWHVAAKSKYIYDRTADYQVPASSPEVKTLTLHDKDYDIVNGHYHLSILEHCTSDQQLEILVDGISGKTMPELRKYLNLPSTVVMGELDKMVAKDSILVPPQTRVSALMRDTLSKMIVGIQADKILEENVEVTCMDLYYHPVFAFQYHWVSKNKKAIVEVDGLTGEVKSGTRVFSEYLGKVLDQNFLFDVGADAAGMFIPGGSIAVKVAKKYLDSKKKK